MTLAQDFEDFVKLFNKHKVDYMVFGGYQPLRIDILNTFDGVRLMMPFQIYYL